MTDIEYKCICTYSAHKLVRNDTKQYKKCK